MMHISYMLDVSADVSDAHTTQYRHNEHVNTLFSAHITTVEYLGCYS